jgi:2-isopropylmalate synthase
MAQDQPQPRVALYDTTLRDGSQSEDVLFSTEDKLRITERLDAFGVDYIEGGWPGANPKDIDFFEQVKGMKLRTSRLVAFGSTRRARNPPGADATLRGLLEAETGVITIFGKTWDLHVTKALKISLEENLDLIASSVEYLKRHTDVVFYDAEHFFDGYKAHPSYALKTLRAAWEAGAGCLVLCDTNGGTLPEEIAELTAIVRERLGAAEVGIHCHNDAGLAVANTLAAVRAGATQVQGTINGIGERCGNANLVTVLPNLMLKMGCSLSMDAQRLTQLSRLSGYVYEMINQPPSKNDPYVGRSAFAHKGGIHASAVLRDPITYEHVCPEQVGNIRRLLVSEQAGRSNLVHMFRRIGLKELDAQDPRLSELLQLLKEKEHQGYQFEGAEASFELVVRRMLGDVPDYFTLRGFRVIDERWNDVHGHRVLISDASVKVEVHGSQQHFMAHTAAEGNGPVNALDSAFRKALRNFYPELEQVRLVDFKVRIHRPSVQPLVDGRRVVGTDAQVRVMIESTDERGERWGTVGVSENVIAAAYDALVDSMVYKLFKDGVKPKGTIETTVAVGA